METLSRHIIVLLSRHDCVILPGVGAFIATRRSARYNEAAGRWIPPTRHISFNSAVRSDDGLLAHSYARCLKVDFEQARKELDLALAQLMNSLQSGLPFQIGSLGSLILEDSARFVFRPSQTPGQREGSLGLHAFPMQPLASASSDEATEATASVAVSPDAVTPTDAADLSTDASAADMLPEDTASEISAEEVTSGNGSGSAQRKPFGPFKRFRRKALRVAAVCAAVAIGAASLLIPRAIGHDTQLASVVPVPVKIEKTVKTETPEQVPSAVIPASGSEAGNKGASAPCMPDTAPTATEASGQDDAQKRYHLIVATFTSRAEAEKYISVKGASGDGRTLSIVPGRKVIRVAAAASDDRETLLTAMRTDGFSREFPDSWIWEKE